VFTRECYVEKIFKTSIGHSINRRRSQQKVKRESEIHTTSSNLKVIAPRRQQKHAILILSHGKLKKKL
jgi:hypothetical protein